MHETKADIVSLEVSVYPLEHEIIDIDRKKAARPSGRAFYLEREMGDRVEIRRCQHIKVNGTQCGSPARRNEPHCHYHRENQPARVKVGGEGGVDVLIPVLEDAQSIQSVVRQVVMLVLGGKIDNKQAGVVLYALQIASSNLKRMEVEKPRPAQVVVDPEKVAETPMGMTPWTAKERGQELEDEDVGFQGEIAEKLKREARSARERLEMYSREARKMAGEALNELKREPKMDYDQMRRSLASFADMVKDYLGRPVSSCPPPDGIWK